MDHQYLDESNENKEVKSIPMGRYFYDMEADRKRKRKRQCKRMEFDIEDPVQTIISRLDMRSLFKSLAVCKAWNSFIQSPCFKWKPTSTEVCLLSHTCLEVETVIWSPSTGLSLKLTLSPSSGFKHFGLVAASRGLVCVRSTDSDWRTYQLVVGNPLTNKWVDLPVLFSKHDLGPYKMEVLDCGAFRVGAFVLGNAYNAYFVYDSVTDRWCVTRLHVPHGENFKYMFYNFVNNCWETDIIRDIRIITELKLQHATPYNSCLWRYNHQLYVASPWYDTGTLDGFGVWRVDRDKKELKLVNATLASRFADNETLARYSSVVCSSAEDNLVCFQIWNFLVIVYDMGAGAWSCCSSKLPCSGVRSLVYCPSLHSPHRD